MKTNIEIVDFLKDNEILKSKEIIDAFYHVDRKDFVLEEDKNDAYINTPLSIWYWQTISQPSTVAFMLELLSPKSWENILDIWTWSWWTTTLLWYIVWKWWYVTWLERIDELVDFGNKNLKKYKLTNSSILKAWKYLWIPWNKFDKILVSAWSKSIPKELLEQLKVWWIIVVPIQTSVCKIEKKTNKDFSLTGYPNFAFVPLIY